MNQKESIVLGAHFVDSFKSKYGELFNHHITFENGDSGTYSSKSYTQTKFKIGESTVYLIDEASAHPKIKVPYTNTKDSNVFDDGKISNKTLLNFFAEVREELAIIKEQQEEILELMRKYDS